MSDHPLRFSPFGPLPIVIILVLIFSFFAYCEFRSKQKFRALRIVAISLVMISMMGILLKPTYLKEANHEPVLLLTKDYPKTKIDSISKFNPKLKVIRTKNSSSYSGSSTLDSWHDLTNENILCVAGQGIPGYVLDVLPNKNFQFIPAPLPHGITKLQIPVDLHKYGRGRIAGTYNASEKRMLKLLGPDGPIDSTSLDIGENSFSFSFTPKEAGNFIYSLVDKDSKGALYHERLPIQVLRESQLRILFIQEFPTAEVRFLKNFLSGRRHQIAVRYQISKNNYIYEYANLQSQRIEYLHTDLLKSFDLLFIDQKSYDELSKLERVNLKKSINNGLGVIFLLNNEKEKALGEFLPIKSSIASHDTVHVHLSSLRLTVLPAVPIELDYAPSIIPITRNKNRILSGYFRLGWGKIGFQFLQETFRLGIEGDSDGYSSLWTSLISNTARTKESNFKLKLVTPFPFYSNQPIDFVAFSNGLEPMLYADSIRIPMKENALVDDYWTGRSWCGKGGWHQLRITQDFTQLNYFISDTSEWKTLEISNQIRNNNILGHSVINKSARVAQQVPVSNLIFYLLFLFSSGFLWLAPKI